MKDLVGGPWTYEGTFPSDGFDYIRILDKDRGEFASVNGPQLHPFVEARAKVIAAAPDLLDCLSKTRALWIRSIFADEILAVLKKAGAPQPPKPEAAS